MEIKKTWESVLAYPSPQAFALPPTQDKQRSRPRQEILYGIPQEGYRYNTPNVDVPVAVSFE